MPNNNHTLIALRAQLRSIKQQHDTIIARGEKVPNNVSVAMTNLIETLTSLRQETERQRKNRS
jgi:hypothetical protein